MADTQKVYFDEKAHKQIVGLIDNAYREYLAARVLFDNMLLQPACIMANTAIEKSLKIPLLISGKYNGNKSHDVFALFNILKRGIPELENLINSDFLKSLSKIYRSRYYEDLSPGYSYVIIRNRFLAELDNTFIVLAQLVNRVEPEPLKTLFHVDIENKENKLFKNNHILANQMREDFLSQPDDLLEFKILKNHVTMEVIARGVFPKENHTHFPLVSSAIVEK